LTSKNNLERGLGLVDDDTVQAHLRRRRGVRHAEQAPVVVGLSGIKKNEWENKKLKLNKK
jgi:hypothetical protein